MSDPDLEVTEDALATMRHEELVALLNRLYAKTGEPGITASSARASSDDELRERIRGACCRLLARASQGRPADPASTAPPTAKKRRRSASAPASRRSFVVLVSEDQALARRARASCATRGIALVWVASLAAVMRLSAGVTPTHMIIDGAAESIDDASVRELRTRGTRVRWCRGAQETLDALVELD